MRARLLVAFLAFALLAGGASYALVRGRLEAVAAGELDRRFGRRVEAATDAMRQVELSAGDAAARIARSRTLVAAARETGSGRQRALFLALEAAITALAAERAGLGRPDLAVVTDARGVVLARDVDADAWTGRDLAVAFPVVARGVASESTGVVRFGDDGRHYLVAVHSGEGGFAVLVGYAVGDGLAERLARASMGDVLLYVDGRVVGTSLTDPEQRRRVEGGALGEHRAAADAAVARRGFAGTTHSHFPEGELAFSHGTLPVGREALGAVLVDDGTSMTRFVSVADGLLFMTAILALAAIALAFKVAGLLLRPVFALERALAALVDGDREPTLELFDTPLGGVAYRVHELVTHLAPKGDGSPGPHAPVR